MPEDAANADIDEKVAAGAAEVSDLRSVINEIVESSNTADGEPLPQETLDKLREKQMQLQAKQEEQLQLLRERLEQEEKMLEMQLELSERESAAVEALMQQEMAELEKDGAVVPDGPYGGAAGGAAGDATGAAGPSMSAEERKLHDELEEQNDVLRRLQAVSAERDAQVEMLRSMAAAQESLGKLQVTDADDDTGDMSPAAAAAADKENQEAMDSFEAQMANFESYLAKQKQELGKHEQQLAALQAERDETIALNTRMVQEIEVLKGDLLSGAAAQAAAKEEAEGSGAAR